jgi:hypothetical protein
MTVCERAESLFPMPSRASVGEVGSDLGAALATLCALDSEIAQFSNGQIEVVTFASPRVGDTR